MASGRVGATQLRMLVPSPPLCASGVRCGSTLAPTGFSMAAASASGRAAGAKAKSSATGKPTPPRASSGKAKGGNATKSPKQQAASSSRVTIRETMAVAPLRGGFNRMVREHGFSFTVVTYVTGELLSISLTALLYCDVFGVGDMVTWLQYLGLGTAVFPGFGEFMEKGLSVFGFRFTLRLFADYLAANAVTTPLRPYHVMMCRWLLPVVMAASAPLLKRLPAIGWGRRVVPKAPSATSAPKSAKSTTTKAFIPR